MLIVTAVNRKCITMCHFLIRDIHASSAAKMSHFLNIMLKEPFGGLRTIEIANLYELYAEGYALERFSERHLAKGRGKDEQRWRRDCEIEWRISAT